MRHAVSLPTAAILEAEPHRARTIEDLKTALTKARNSQQTTVVVIEVDPEARVLGHESWRDVAIAEVSESETVQTAREDYEVAVKRERRFL